MAKCYKNRTAYTGNVLPLWIYYMYIQIKVNNTDSSRMWLL